jgi:hypothetical protein
MGFYEVFKEQKFGLLIGVFAVESYIGLIREDDDK